MVTVIANLNNVALGLTSFHVLWINTRFLPPRAAAALVPTSWHRLLRRVLPRTGDAGVLAKDPSADLPVQAQ